MAAFGGTWKTTSGSGVRLPPPKTTMFRTGQAQAKQTSPTGTAYRAAAAPASIGAYASSMDKPAPPAPAAPNSNRGYAAPPAPSPPPMFPIPASFAYQTNRQNRTYNAPSYSANAPNADDYVPHIMPGGVMSRASIMRDATPQQLQVQLNSMMQDYRNEQNDYNKLNKRRFSRPPTIEDARREYGARAQLSTPTG